MSVRDPRVNRRQLLAGAAAASVAAESCRKEPRAPASTATSPAPRFFTRGELKLLDELTEVILPADSHSPGARAAGVALEIDRLVADLLPRLAEHAETRRFWKEGLRRVDGLCRREHGAAFVRASPRQRLAVVTGIARGELDPQAPEEHFFVMLKAATARAYYTSQLGIQKDLGYQGNSYLEEFVGHDPDEPL